MLRKWQDLQRRTWRDFIRPFVMLQKCVKARELAKTYSVYFYDEEELKKCKKINNHNLDYIIFSILSLLIMA